MTHKRQPKRDPPAAEVRLGLPKVFPIGSPEAEAVIERLRAKYAAERLANKAKWHGTKAKKGDSA